MQPTARPLATELSAWGKIPSRPDFVAHNVSTRSGAQLTRWLSSAVEEARRRNLRSRLSSPMGFVFPGENGTEGPSTLLTGVLQPSQDSVGRQFPLAVFVERASDLAGEAAGHSPRVDPVIHNDEIEQLISYAAEAARAVLDCGGDLHAALYESTALDHVVPTDEVLAVAHAPTATLLQTPARRLQAMLASRETPSGSSELRESHYFAWRMLSEACREALLGGLGAECITLDCPARGAHERATWINSVYRLTGMGRVPLGWFFGSDAGHPSANRLLVTLGAPASSILWLLGDPDAKTSRLWPMSTGDERLAERMRQSLSASERAAIDAPDATFESVIRALGAATFESRADAIFAME